MFNEHPPASRYQEVWDVGLVVNYIQDGPPTTDLSLKELSKRTVMLLELCNANRASEIKVLDIRFKRSVGEDDVFTIPGLAITRHSGPPKEEWFSTFKETDCSCSVQSLQIYMERTARRGDNEVIQLIISYKKPYKPMTSGSISVLLLHAAVISLKESAEIP
jgi:hypothetical protein